MSKVYTRKSIFENLKKYCIHAGKDDYMEVTEWKNGEGIDVNVSSKQGNQIIQLTWGEFELLTKLASIITK